MLANTGWPRKGLDPGASRFDDLNQCNLQHLLVQSKCCLLSCCLFSRSSCGRSARPLGFHPPSPPPPTPQPLESLLTLQRLGTG